MGSHRCSPDITGIATAIGHILELYSKPLWLKNNMSFTELKDKKKLN